MQMVAVVVKASLQGQAQLATPVVLELLLVQVAVEEEVVAVLDHQAELQLTLVLLG
jgi:hypothetical protein